MSRTLPTIRRFWRWLTHAIWVVTIALLSPFLEKNPEKLLATTAPVIFSMTRILLAGFGVGMYYRLRGDKPMGWPEAFVVTMVIIGPELVRALRKSDPAAVLDFAKAVVGRMGIGQIAQWSGDHETMVDREHEVITSTDRAP